MHKTVIYVKLYILVGISFSDFSKKYTVCWHFNLWMPQHVNIDIAWHLYFMI